MEHNDTARRRLSVDSGAPSSNLDGDNQRHETELKQPLNQRYQQQYKNFMRHGRKSGNTSDASSVMSCNPQTTDTEASMNVMKTLDNVLGKRPSKKGKHSSSSESPYNVHIGKIVINNNPKQDNPYYFDHPPPPPCVDNYTYIKDHDARSVYYNMDRDPIEQGTTPRNNSMEMREDEQELHAMINPYRETEDFVNVNRTTRNRATEGELAGSIQVKNDQDYGYLVNNPEFNIDGVSGELEITLRTKGPKPMVWKGKLTPNSQQISTPENNTPKDKTTIPQNEPESPRVTEEPRHQQVNAPTDAVAMRDNRSQAAASSETPLNRLVLGNVSSARAVSAPDLVIPSAVSNIQNVPVQTAMQQNRNHLNLSSSVPGINTTSSYNHLHGRGNEPMLQQPQTTRPISEKGMFPFSKPKGKRKHTCNIDGNVYHADDRIINRIRDDLLEYGKETMWTLVDMKNQPTHPYSLLVKINGQILTYPISEYKKGKYTIDNKQKKTFQCICSLIQYYRSNKIPMASVNLGPRYHHNPPSPVYISPTYSDDTPEVNNTRL